MFLDFRGLGKHFFCIDTFGIGNLAFLREFPGKVALDGRKFCIGPAWPVRVCKFQLLELPKDPMISYYGQMSFTH